MASPPKPWERGTAAATTTSAPAPTTMSTPASSASSSTPPTVPERPAALTNTSSALTTNLATANAFANPYAASPYSTTPYSSYSPYNRFGSTYSPYGMNSMNSMYGGVGSYGSYGGYGGYGGGGMYGGLTGMPGYGLPGAGGLPGMPGYDPANPTLSQTLESTTQHTFALLHSLVQTFAGVAQMLESTFVATHSSFFAVVGVVDQFAQLRNALGGVLGLFGLVRWMRELVTGPRPSASALRNEFKDFVSGRPVQGPSGAPAARPSKKPLIIFLIAIFGIPYAMHKLVRLLIERQQQQAAEAGAGALPGTLPGAQGLPPLDPSQLAFARALYAFDASSPAELSLKENEIVAIMGKLDPTTGQEVDPRIEVEGSEWWKGRTRDGREGWFPKKWVQVLERKATMTDAKKIE